MLSLILIASTVLTGCVFAYIIPQLQEWINEGEEKTADQVSRPCQVVSPPRVCPFQVGKYWQICPLTRYSDAADACAAFGWRLAMINEENSAQVAQLMTSCGSRSNLFWNAGIRGLAGNPCSPAFTLRNQIFAFQNYGYNACNGINGAVLCEEMPQVTVSQTETLFNQTITFGQTTTTTQSISTRTVRPYHPQCSDCSDSSSGSKFCSDSSSGSTYCSSSSDSSCDWTSDNSSCSSSVSSSGESWCPPRGRLHHKMLKSNLDLSPAKHCPRQNSSVPVCYGQNCLPVCNLTMNGIHLITAFVNYTNATAECEKYGWSLLDFNLAQASDMADISRACNGIFVPRAFINSCNGVKSDCLLVQAARFSGLLSSIVTVPANDSGCFANPLSQIYCQERCPFPVVERGMEVGQLSLTTDLSVSTTTLFTPSTTVVIRESCTESVFIDGK